MNASEEDQALLILNKGMAGTHSREILLIYRNVSEWALCEIELPKVIESLMAIAASKDEKIIVEGWYGTAFSGGGCAASMLEMLPLILVDAIFVYVIRVQANLSSEEPSEDIPIILMQGAAEIVDFWRVGWINFEAGPLTEIDIIGPHRVGGLLLLYLSTKDDNLTA